ncbi:Protein LYK2 [Hirschfeldia incana]|nr:Protein LYK2 [Hirschfeldia incana]
MAGSVSKECMTSLLMFFFFTWTLCSTSHELLSCDPEDASTSSYVCHSNLQKCRTFAILRASSPLRGHQLQFIPIDCTCNGRFYEAHLFKTCVKGDTFRSVAASLQGLTTCLSIRDKNPQVSEESLDENVKLRLAVKCSCPEEEKGVSNAAARFLVTYPVSEGESVSSLADKFNTTEDAIVSANNKSGVVPRTPALIPLDHKPHNATLLPPSRQKKKKRSKKLMLAVISAIAGVIGLITLMVLGYLHWKKETRLQSWIISNKDPETRQLSLSIRTTSDKKISFEGSQDGSILDSVAVVGTTTPRKPVLEIYSFDELEKATENFSSSNHIKGSVYFGSLKGKDLAIKQVSEAVMKRFDFGLLNDQSHYYSHNLMRVLGTCFRESDEGGCYLVYEYAKNGSLWDWLQNKLAIKNQFIESCYCFLAWKQRIKICHDVAIALKFMHRINYVHGSIMSRNIFLNEDLRGKVGNFGMSSKDGSSATDVFSYGIILMEVLSGQTPEMLLGQQEEEEEEKNRVPEWKRLRAVLGEEKEMLREVMDSTLGESYSVESAYEMARLATDCTAEEAELRPSAAEIVERVSRLVDEDEAVVIQRDNTTLISESSYKPLVRKGGSSSSIDEC